MNFNLASLVAQMVNNLPTVQETWFRSLGWEDPLKDGIATHSSILAWRIPMNRGAWQATVHGGCKELDMTEHTHTHIGCLLWARHCSRPMGFMSEPKIPASLGLNF